MVEGTEIDEYLPIGYIDSIKFTVIIVRTRIFFTVGDVLSIFGVDLSQKAVAVNEYDEELITPIVLKRVLTDIKTDTKIKDFKYMENAANNLLKLMR